MENAPPRFTLRQGLWFLALFGCLNLGGFSGGIVGARLPFVLKDELRLGPEGFARFWQIIAIPGFFALVYGFLRDRWSPFGLGDRGLLLVFGPLVALPVAGLAVAGVDYPRLLGAYMLAGVAGGMIVSAVNGTQAVFGQRLAATGRLSAMAGAMGALTATLGLEIGGWLASRASLRAALALAATLKVGIFLLALWPARGAFPERERVVRSSEALTNSLGRLLRCRPFLAAAIFRLVWDYAPTSGTPLTFRLTNELGFDPSQLAHFNAIFNLALIPGSLAYVLVARRWPLRRTLFFGVLIAVPQPFTYLLMRNPGEAYLANAFVGLTSGMVSAAAFDLLLRTVPRGLEGMGFAVASTLSLLYAGQADVWASRLYATSGYPATVWVTLAIFIALFLLVAAVPDEPPEGVPADESTVNLRSTLD